MNANIAMQKTLLSFLFCFALINTSAQKHENVTIYFLTQYNKTIYDRTIGNNPSGVGLALQSFLITRTRFQPTAELTGDIYLGNDKVLRLNPDGSIPAEDNDVRSMVNLFAGVSFNPATNIYLMLTTGPSFIGGQAKLGIKPSFGFHFSKSKKWTGKISYINIFNRQRTAKDDFGSLSVAIGIKLF